MSKRTEAEWEALAARLAKEVMGWSLNDELTQQQRHSLTGKHILVSQTCSPSWWGCLGGVLQFIVFVSKWQPHLNVAQPLVVTWLCPAHHRARHKARRAGPAP